MAVEHLGTDLSIFQQRTPFLPRAKYPGNHAGNLQHVFSRGCRYYPSMCVNSYCHICIELPTSNEKKLNILWYPRQPHSKELSGLAVPSLRNPHRMCSLPWVHNRSLTLNIYVFYQSKFCFLLFIVIEPDESGL